jgi:uncharacterized protein YkwD
MKSAIIIVIVIVCSAGILLGIQFVPNFNFTESQMAESKGDTKFTDCVMVTFGTVNADITCDEKIFHLVRDLPLKANQVKDVSVSIVNDVYTIEFNSPLNIPIIYEMKNPEYNSEIYQQVAKNIFEINTDFNFEGEIDDVQDSISGVPLMVEHIIQETRDTITIPNVSIPEVNIPNSESSNYSHRELQQLVLDNINMHRGEHGVESIILGNAKAPQIYAEELAEEGCIHHVSNDGEGPMLRYKNNNDKIYLVWENLAGGYSAWDKKQAIINANYDMMYDDAHANWGHRDNIVNPRHSSVSIGITFDYGKLVMVQDFEQPLQGGYQHHPSNFEKREIDHKLCW